MVVDSFTSVDANATTITNSSASSSPCRCTSINTINAPTHPPPHNQSSIHALTHAIPHEGSLSANVTTMNPVATLTPIRHLVLPLRNTSNHRNSLVFSVVGVMRVIKLILVLELVLVRSLGLALVIIALAAIRIPSPILVHVPTPLTKKS